MRVEGVEPRVPYHGSLAAAMRRACCAVLVGALACACTVVDRNPQAAFATGAYREAARGWEVLAAGGNPVAQNALGILYFSGMGVKRDRDNAFYWFGRAALRGNANAQRNLAMLFELGLTNLPRDNVRAIGWYLEARRNGNAHANLALQALGSEVTTNQVQQGMAIVAADLAQGRISKR